jgi:hypothetical protein
MEFLEMLYSSGAAKLIASSAVLAALITSLVNYMGLRRTNSRLLEIEHMKSNSEMITFRYTKIYEALEELSKIPAIEYDFVEQINDQVVHNQEKLAKVTLNASYRYDTFKKVYYRVKPLLTVGNSITAQDIIDKAEILSNEMVEKLHTNQKPRDGHFTELILTRQKAESAIEVAFSKEITCLTVGSGSVLDTRQK